MFIHIFQDNQLVAAKTIVFLVAVYLTSVWKNQEYLF